MIGTASLRRVEPCHAAEPRSGWADRGAAVPARRRSRGRTAPLPDVELTTLATWSDQAGAALVGDGPGGRPGHGGTVGAGREDGGMAPQPQPGAAGGWSQLGQRQDDRPGLGVGKESEVLGRGSVVHTIRCFPI